MRDGDEIVNVEYQNPHASSPLRVPVLVVCNTPDAELERNIRTNSARADLDWVAALAAHDMPAVMVGGGASAEEHLRDIARLQRLGAKVFAMNGASAWLASHGIVADAQVISDAKAETAQLVDMGARNHLFASQVNPATMMRVRHPLLWHLAIDDIERLFPEERVRRGGYALIGGDATVGISALCLAFALGYRTFHVFGYDSCHSGVRSHAYEQPMNRFMPTVNVDFSGKTYKCTLAMKLQAEKFQSTAKDLKDEGCVLHVYGDGLPQAMYRTGGAVERMATVDLQALGSELKCV